MSSWRMAFCSADISRPAGMCIGLLPLQHVDLVLPTVNIETDLRIVVAVGYVKKELCRSCIVLPTRVPEHLPALNGVVFSTFYCNAPELKHKVFLAFLPQHINLRLCCLCNCWIIRCQLSFHHGCISFHIIRFVGRLGGGSVRLGR